MTKSSQLNFVNSNLPFLRNVSFVNPAQTYKSEYSEKFLPNKIKKCPPAKPREGTDFSMTDPRYLSLWSESITHSEHGLKTPTVPIDKTKVLCAQNQTNFKNHCDPFFESNLQTTTKDSYKALPIKSPHLHKMQRSTLRSDITFGDWNCDSIYVSDFKPFVDALPAKSYDWIKYTISPIYKEHRLHTNNTETGSNFIAIETIKRPESICPISSDVISKSQEPWPQTSYVLNYRPFPINQPESRAIKLELNLGDLRKSNEEYRRSVTKSDFQFNSINERATFKPPKTSVFKKDVNIGEVNYTTSTSFDDYPVFEIKPRPFGDFPDYSHHFLNFPYGNPDQISWPETTNRRCFPMWEKGERYPQECYPPWELASKNDIEMEKRRVREEETTEEVESLRCIRNEIKSPVNKAESHIKILNANLRKLSEYETTNKLHFKAPGIVETKLRHVKETPKAFPYFSTNISGRKQNDLISQLNSVQ